MAGVSISTDAPQLVALLERLSGMLSDPSPQLEQAKSIMAAQEAAVWASEGEILGHHWAAIVQPWRKATSEPLVATGALRNSLTTTAAGQVSGNTLSFGTDVFYGRWHQSGTKRMAAREILGVSPAFARAIVNVFSEAVGEIIGETGPPLA